MSEDAVKVDYFDAEDVARAALGLAADADSEAVENALDERLGISMDRFHQVVELLVPLTPTCKAAVSGKLFHGFLRDGDFLVKVEAPV